MRPILLIPVLAFLALFAFLALGRRRVQAVVRVSRVVADLGRAEAFYRDGLGFLRMSTGPCDPALSAVLGLSHVRGDQVVMRLGCEEIALVRFGPPGAPYPAGSRSDNGWFQHLAIVVGDMEAAHRQLAALGPQPISTQGAPVTLPPRNGGVSAFKFRDPDGHPLELIHFPAGQGRAVWAGRTELFLGIDHSAIAARRTARSVRFYRRLGFSIAARSDNYGDPQSRLDGLVQACAQVTGLRPPASGSMGLELLCYDPPGRVAPRGPANDVVTDWVTLLVPGLPRPRLLWDPDGHRMLLVGQADMLA